MVKEILSNLYCIELPLPRNPLKSINVYVIKGPDRNLIIDTGMNREECKAVLFPGLKELGIDLLKTDIFVSHLHSDHFGLVGDLATDGTRLYFSQPEASIVMGERHWADLLDFYLANGFPDEALQKSVASHPGFLYSPKRIPEITIIKDKQVIEVGDFRFECIETPGHSPGHMCLYEADKKIFFSGDHILFDITPNISYWPELEDALGAYLSSLEKVQTLDVTLVLPGHRSSWHNHRERIKTLNEHHSNRLKEALSALEDGEKTAYDIAPYITWKIESASWEQFPAAQKWFAVGETIAHLHYLENKHKIKRRTANGRILFSRA
ncbi:MAG: MBL fold metallo-hydrolase [Chloroflexi bacterium]|nr:MBL fold metallo-hydrolase [Chloroflexota bacterium]